MKPVIIMENWKLDVFQGIWSRHLGIMQTRVEELDYFCLDAFVHGLKAAARWAFLPWSICLSFGQQDKLHGARKLLEGNAGHRPWAGKLLRWSRSGRPATGTAVTNP